MRYVALIAALVIAMGPKCAAFGAEEDSAFATSVQVALSSGDWQRVVRLFPRNDDPTLKVLNTRWNRLRLGGPEQAEWDVKFTPFYQLGTRRGGRLKIVAKTKDGQESSWRFDREIVRRGNAWLAGDSLDLGRTDVSVTAHNIAIDLRERDLTATDTLDIASKGPDHRLFLRLAPDLKVTEARLGDRAWPVVQVDDVVYLQVPDEDRLVALKLSYRGPRPFQELKGQIVLPPRMPWYPSSWTGEFAAYRLTALLPPGMEATAAGTMHPIERAGDRWTYLWTSELPIAGEGIFGGAFERVENAADGKRLSTLMLVGARGLGTELLENARGALEFFTAHYGDLGLGDLCIVQASADPELSSRAGLLLPESVAFTPRFATGVVTRALTRLWTGNVRYVGSPFERRFMTEGVSSYLSLLYWAQAEGGRPFREGLAAAKAELMKPHMAPDELSPRRGLTATQVDARSILVLQMLRQQIGNEAFDQALRALYAGGGEQVDLRTFCAAFEKSSNKVLEPFFDQWLGHDGYPEFTLDNLEVVARQHDRFEVRGEIIQGAPAYFLNLPLVVTTDRGPILYNVPLRSLRTPFKLVVHARPDKLFLDPLNDVLAAPVESVSLIKSDTPRPTAP